MTTAIGAYPTQLFDRKADHYRVQWLFNAPVAVKPLYLIEKNFRAGLEKAATVWPFLRRHDADPDDRGISIVSSQGWLVVDANTKAGRHLRLGISRSGTVFVNALEPTGRAGPTLFSELRPHALADSGALLGRVLHCGFPDGAGTIELGVHDVKGFQLRADPSKTSSEDELSALPAGCSLSRPDTIAPAIAGCICEIAVQFRDRDGGALLDHDKLVEELSAMIGDVRRA